MNNFHVGQRVVCIVGSDWWFTIHPWEIHPVLNGIYTIRSIELGSCRATAKETVCVRLTEIRNPTANYSDGLAEVQFDVAAFRPLHETKTDISIFRKLVEPKALAKFKERVDA